MPAWKPILDGDLAGDAWRAIRDVALAVRQLPTTPNNAMDVALFSAYVAEALDDAWIAAQYDESCVRLCTSISELRSVGLHGGLAGAGWVIAHISEPDSADDQLAAIDEVLVHALEVDRWTREYDLVYGLVGLGVYFIERLTARRSEIAVRALHRIVDHLVATSEATDDGTTWHTSPELMPTWQLAAAPAGYYNCGVAHGVPGVVGLLGRLARIRDPRVDSLCDDAMRWMRAQTLEGVELGATPDFALRDQRPQRPARTAWCYGDPGVAIASWSAATHRGSSAQEWERLAVLAATRDAALCRVVDPGLCHGSAGLAHIYNRLYQASGEHVFREAAQRWIANLDIEELERRLELAAPSGQVRSWCTADEVAPCGGDCSNLCGVNVT